MSGIVVKVSWTKLGEYKMGFLWEHNEASFST